LGAAVEECADGEDAYHVQMRLMMLGQR
jgi:hypothetical protein